MDLVFKFRKARELVLNTCGGTAAITKECLQLPGHHRFAGFEKRSACFQDALSSLVVACPKRVSIPESDIVGS